MDTNAAREALNKEQERLLNEMRSLGQPTPGVPGEWELLPQENSFEPDPLDQAEIVTHREDNAAILADLEARHASVAEALARIESGTYGVCEVCNEPIEQGRLAADPAALTCTKHR